MNGNQWRNVVEEVEACTGMWKDGRRRSIRGMGRGVPLCKYGPCSLVHQFNMYLNLFVCPVKSSEHNEWFLLSFGICVIQIAPYLQ